MKILRIELESDNGLYKVALVRVESFKPYILAIMSELNTKGTKTGSFYPTEAELKNQSDYSWLATEVFAFFNNLEPTSEEDQLMKQIVRGLLHDV